MENPFNWRNLRKTNQWDGAASLFSAEKQSSPSLCFWDESWAIQRGGKIIDLGSARSRGTIAPDVRQLCRRSGPRPRADLPRSLSEAQSLGMLGRRPRSAVDSVVCSMTSKILRRTLQSPASRTSAPWLKSGHAALRRSTREEIENEKA